MGRWTSRWYEGDIAAERVEVVVNAANSALAGGSGVDGAIHAAAGPALAEACRLLRATTLPDGLPVGDAVATPGFDLPARWVVHTVGPVFAAAQADRRRPLLRACHLRALAVAADLDAASVAFPAISTGVYGWPLEDAARVAVGAVRESGTTASVRFVLFSAAAYEAFARAL